MGDRERGKNDNPNYCGDNSMYPFLIPCSPFPFYDRFYDRLMARHSPTSTESMPTEPTSAGSSHSSMKV